MAVTFTGEVYPIALNDFIFNQKFYSFMIDFFRKISPPYRSAGINTART
jgi:hypothetical protein